MITEIPGKPISMFSQKTFSFTMPIIQPITDDGDFCLPGNLRKKESITAKFNRFHQRNPHVYHLIVDISKRMKRSGIRKFGMKGVFEYLRWQYSMQTQGERYRLNNIYTSIYARLVMETEVELKGFFETRKRLEE
jgi:hypothetical protein